MARAEYIDEVFQKIESGEAFEAFMKSELPDGLKALFSDTGAGDSV